MSTTNSDGVGREEEKPEEAHSKRSLIQSTSLLSLGTLSSRILGFFRDIILAKILGTGMGADAFFVALKIPNLFRDMVGEGATNAAVVPVLSEYAQKDKKDFWKFVNVVFILGLIILSVITVLGMIFAPLVVRILTPGFVSDPEKFHLTVNLTRVIFPYLILIGLTAYGMAVLYTFRSFWIPAFSPTLFNIALIISALLAFKFMKEPVYGLAIGTLVGGVWQLWAHARPILKLGYRFEKPDTLKHPGAVKIGRLLIPRAFGGGVYQLSVFIDTFCASLSSIVGEGGISAIYYSNRIIQFPMGIFSIALASVVLPTISGLAQKKDMESIKKTLVFSLENIFFVMCPTTVVLFLLSHPIIKMLFERGEFGPYSTHITASALSFYAIGLFSFGGIKILVAGFHALQDTKTPVKVAALCLLINTVLIFILMYPLKIGGIALSSAIAGTMDFLILFYIMDKKLGGLNSGLFGYFVRVTIASGIVGIIEYLAWNHLLFMKEPVRLWSIGIGGFILFEFVCLAMKVEQAQKIAGWVTGWFKKK
jgi:putative peptidoglycan lipid II flippase